MNFRKIAIVLQHPEIFDPEISGQDVALGKPVTRVVWKK